MAVKLTQEQQVLAEFQSRFALGSLYFTAIGIQLVLVFSLLFHYLDAPTASRKGQRLYISLSFLILLFYTFSEMGCVKYFTVQYKSGLLGSNKSMAVVNELYGIEDAKWHGIPRDLSANVVIWLGDGLLLFRCWAMWRFKPWVMIFPFITYVLSFAFSLMVLVGPRSKVIFGIYQQVISGWILSCVLVNAMITGLIVYRLLVASRSVASAHSNSHRNKNMYIKIINILAESAAPLAIIGVIYGTLLILNYQSNGETWTRPAKTAFQSMWYPLTAISPQMIIYRIAMTRFEAQNKPKSSGSVGGSLGIAHASQSGEMEINLSVMTSTRTDSTYKDRL